MIQFIDKENIIVLIRSEDKAAGKPEYSLICIEFHFVYIKSFWILIVQKYELNNIY